MKAFIGILVKGSMLILFITLISVLAFAPDAGQNQLLLSLITVLAMASVMLLWGLWQDCVGLMLGLCMRDLTRDPKPLMRAEYVRRAAGEMKRWKLAPVILSALVVLTTGLVLLLCDPRRALSFLAWSLLPFGMVLRVMHLLGCRRLGHLGALHFMDELRSDKMLEKLSLTERIRLFSDAGRLYHQHFYMLYLYLHDAVTVHIDRLPPQNAATCRIEMNQEQRVRAMALPLAEEPLMQHVIGRISDACSDGAKGCSLDDILEEGVKYGADSDEVIRIRRLADARGAGLAKDMLPMHPYYLVCALALPLVCSVAAVCTGDMSALIPLALGVAVFLLALHDPRRETAEQLRRASAACAIMDITPVEPDPRWFDRISGGVLTEEERDAFLRCFITRYDALIAEARRQSPQGFVVALHDVAQREQAKHQRLLREGRRHEA